MTIEEPKPRSPITWVPSLYLAEGLPFFAVMIVARQMYKSFGVSNEDIAFWTNMIGFAWVFKPLWSPFLELTKTKKRPIILFQFIGGISLGAIALCLQLPQYFAISIGLLGIVAIASATHDIVADGLYIANLSNTQQAAYAGWQGAFYNAAKFISLGGLLILAGILEKHMSVASAWAIVFMLLCLMLVLLSAYHSWALPTTKNSVEVKSVAIVFNTLVDVIIDFFRKPGILIAILFIILFRAGEGQIQTIGPLFLRDLKEHGGLGLSTDQVGYVYGTVGTVAFLLGSILGGYFSAWLGLRRALPLLIITMNFPNIVFFFLSTALPDNIFVIGTALSIEMFGYGFGFVGLILFMMQVVAVGKYQTAHYALATGVMQLGMILSGMLSGKIQSELGYKTFFIWVLVSAIPALVLTRFLGIKDQEKPKIN